MTDDRLRRVLVCHVVFPKPNVLRPVSEFVYDAARIVSELPGVDLEVLIPVPLKRLRAAQALSRRARGAAEWSDEVDEALNKLDPKPTLIPFVPVPKGSVESAATAMAAAMIGRTRVRRPYVIQGSFLDSGGFAATFVGKALEVPSIAIAHGTDVRMAKSDEDKGRKRRARFAIDGASEVAAVSMSLANDLQSLGRTSRVIPFGSDPVEFPLVVKAPEKPTVAFLGTLGRDKGLDLLLEAASLTKTPFDLKLAGPVDRHFDLQREIARRHLGDRTEVLGELRRSEVTKVFAKSTCLALPSRAEGLPSVIVESLLSGRPVVASDVGGIREILGPSVGELIPANDASALAAALDALFARKFDRETLRKHGLRFARPAMAEGLARLTSELIARSGARR